MEGGTERLVETWTPYFFSFFLYLFFPTSVIDVFVSSYFPPLCLLSSDPWFAPGGGTQIIFWRGVRPEVWNPYPYLRIFLPQKTADLKLFFEIFANRDPFLRVFLPQNGWFYHFFFAIFAKWDPLLWIFLTKMGPMSKDFCWKSNPFGRHIPVCLNMWVPPGDLP